MIDIESIATNLQQGEGDTWFSRTQVRISYPEGGHAFCFGIEDDSFWFRHRNRCIVTLARAYPPGGTLFDVGGGNGAVATALIRAGVETVLVEPGQDGARNARVRGVRPIICSAVEDAGFRPHILPAVGMFDVLEHLEDDERVLRLLHGLIRPLGRLYVTVPAHRWLWSAADDEAGHFRRYSIGSLGAALVRCGYRVEFASYFFWPLVVPIYLLRALPSRLGATRRGEDVNRRELAPAAGWVNHLSDLMLRPEVGRFADKKTVPWGASCIAVATAVPPAG